MLKEIRDALFRIGENVQKEKLFELCPVYFLTHHESNNGYIQDLLNALLCDLEDKELFISKSNTLLYYHLSYNRTDSQLDLFDESGNYKKSLEQWLSYVSMKYHIESGIIMVSIDGDEPNMQDYLWWRQFFSDIRRYKKKFLLFISCDSSFSAVVHSMFEKEFFTMPYQLDSFTVDDYFHWCIAQIGEYPIELNETAKTGLKNILSKYRSDINHHVLKIWLNTLLWNYYSKNGFGEFIFFDCSSEELLGRIIERCRKDSSLRIGFLP